MRSAFHSFSPDKMPQQLSSAHLLQVWTRRRGALRGCTFDLAQSHQQFLQLLSMFSGNGRKGFSTLSYGNSAQKSRLPGYGKPMRVVIGR